MNEKKICFIACTNNDLYMKECELYIEELVIPDGYEIELLKITGAKSMTAGYNEGMAATDAKYKIYMHQDVFIINRHFLYDILSIFESDVSIGMIGMIGYPVVSRCGFMWREEAVGAVPLYGKMGPGNSFRPDSQRGYLHCGAGTVLCADSQGHRPQRCGFEAGNDEKACVPGAADYRCQHQRAGHGGGHAAVRCGGSGSGHLPHEKVSALQCPGAAFGHDSRAASGYGYGCGGIPVAFLWQPDSDAGRENCGRRSGLSGRFCDFPDGSIPVSEKYSAGKSEKVKNRPDTWVSGLLLHFLGFIKLRITEQEA